MMVYPSKETGPYVFLHWASEKGNKLQSHQEMSELELEKDGSSRERGGSGLRSSFLRRSRVHVITGVSLMLPPALCQVSSLLLDQASVMRADNKLQFGYGGTTSCD